MFGEENNARLYEHVHVHDVCTNYRKPMFILTTMKTTKMLCSELNIAHTNTVYNSHTTTRVQLQGKI